MWLRQYDLAHLRADGYGIWLQDGHCLRFLAHVDPGPLGEVVQLLWDEGRGALWRQLEHHFSTPALQAETLRDHEALVAAIESRSPARARKSMHEHLTRVHREFARGFTGRRAARKP